MGYYAKIYLTTVFVFLIIDLIWLLFIAKNVYQKEIGHLMGQTKVLPAAIFYLLFIAGLIFFVINPSLEKGSLLTALITGGFFGLICYGTYDLTNLATLKDWSTIVTILDLIWGTVLNSATAGVVYLIAKHFQWH